MSMWGGGPGLLSAAGCGFQNLRRGAFLPKLALPSASRDLGLVNAVTQGRFPAGDVRHPPGLDRGGQAPIFRMSSLVVIWPAGLQPR